MQTNPEIPDDHENEDQEKTHTSLISTDPARDLKDIRPLPRVSIQIFAETPECMRAGEEAAKDRRMARAHLKVLGGGMSAAIEYFGEAPTPNVIVLESRADPETLLEHLDRLADVCDPGTRVIIVGYINDVRFYRDLIRRGISEYMVGPIRDMDIISILAELYGNPEDDPLGKTIAFIGAKGGAGSSTVAHNVSWSIAGKYETDVVIADLDLPFGTAGLDFNQDPPQGIADAIGSPDRLDDQLLDRILAKCTDKLSLLSAPATLDRLADHDEDCFDGVIKVLQEGVPITILDVPHTWTAWARKTIVNADEIVITAMPDLPNLRNAKNLLDLIVAMRPNDSPPHLVLNQVGMPKKPEIKSQDFADALGLELAAEIPFDPGLFGLASNNGQMVSEADSKNPISEIFDKLGGVVTGRVEVKKVEKSLLGPLLAKFKAKSQA